MTFFDQAKLERIPAGDNGGIMFLAVAYLDNGQRHYSRGGHATPCAALADAFKRRIGGGYEEVREVTRAEWLRWVGGSHQNSPGIVVDLDKHPAGCPCVTKASPDAKAA